ncbi:MAG: hypothetical protein E7632_02700 [Ruminococcaceae bacterium]|nr:hypothetical protein [Oscillospiraceae bacterium]
MKKQAISTVLLMAMLASLAACGTEASTDTTAADTTAETTVAETSYIDTLEQRDMGGREIVFYGQHYEARQNFYMEEKDGEVANDSMHERDLAVEDRLNVKLTFLGEQDRAVVKKTAQTSILAGDEEYNVIMTSISDGMNTLTTAGVLYDLRKIPHLTLDSVYWNKSMYERLEINGAQYFTTGPISYCFYLTPINMRANLRLIDEYQMEDPYELVLSGKWTTDKLSEMAKDKYQDLNQNTKPDVGDFFGLIMDGTFGNALYTGAGLDTVSREGGECKLTLDSEPSVNLIEKYASLFGDRNQYLNDLNGSQSWGTDIFKAGNCIFQPMTILGTLSLRDMVDDFAILPIPKWDEAQKEYYTSCNTWLASGVAVPMNCSIVDDLGLVLETMAYYSYELVTPAVYEITLQGKVSRDDNSAKMLDIIFETAAFDFVTAFNFANVGNMLREMVTGDQSNFMSKYASTKERAQKELDAVIKFGEE